ncbi:hypothetical protein U9M48_024647, partial [Paspalum notatum var. saurae]
IPRTKDQRKKRSRTRWPEDEPVHPVPKTACAYQIMIKDDYGGLEALRKRCSGPPTLSTQRSRVDATLCGNMSQPSTPPFDLCPGHHESMTAKTIIPKGSMKRKAGEPSTDVVSVQHLRPGMVLLKGFVKPEDQIGMVSMCRQLGKGPGGFYRPSLKNGAKLNLWMMSLGKNWDPTARSYGPTRPFDGAQAPTMGIEYKHGA